MAFIRADTTNCDGRDLYVLCAECFDRWHGAVRLPLRSVVVVSIAADGVEALRRQAHAFRAEPHRLLGR